MSFLCDAILSTQNIERKQQPQLTEQNKCAFAMAGHLQNVNSTRHADTFDLTCKFETN
jgi:hypothetical protein